MSSGRAFFVYTALRVLMLLVVGGVMYLVGARGFVLILLAFIVSGALSLVLLDRPRSDASRGLGRVIGRINDKIDAAAAKEDPVEPEDHTPVEAKDEPAEQQPESDRQTDAEAESGQHQG